MVLEYIIFLGVIDEKHLPVVGGLCDLLDEGSGDRRTGSELTDIHEGIGISVSGYVVIDIGDYRCFYCCMYLLDGKTSIIF